MSEINVTPLVDVMLVLLIVFMVAAPLMTVGVPIVLPKTQAKQLSTSTEPLTISVTANNKIYLQDTMITLQELAPKLLALAKNGVRVLAGDIERKRDAGLADNGQMAAFEHLFGVKRKGRESTLFIVKHQRRGD